MPAQSPDHRRRARSPDVPTAGWSEANRGTAIDGLAVDLLRAHGDAFAAMQVDARRELWPTHNEVTLGVTQAVMADQDARLRVTSALQRATITTRALQDAADQLRDATREAQEDATRNVGANGPTPSLSSAHSRPARSSPNAATAATSRPVHSNLVAAASRAQQGARDAIDALDFLSATVPHDVDARLCRFALRTTQTFIDQQEALREVLAALATVDAARDRFVNALERAAATTRVFQRRANQFRSVADQARDAARHAQLQTTREFQRRAIHFRSVVVRVRDTAQQPAAQLQTTRVLDADPGRVDAVGDGRSISHTDPLLNASPATPAAGAATSMVVQPELAAPDGDCAVCLGALRDAAGVEVPSPRGNADMVVRLRRCGHLFHHACITEWAVVRGGPCPLCRQPACVSTDTSTLN